MPKKDLIEDVKDLEDWLEQLGRTVQCVRRIRSTPAWLVRILRENCQLHPGDQWVEATGDTLFEAAERALEAFYTLGESE